MKHAPAAQKSASQSAPRAHPDTAAGSQGVALTPPSYGMGVIDSQPSQAGTIQMKTAAAPAGGDAGAQPVNRTGLPDSLKTGIENLSGMAMDDVRVHFNSAKPAQLQALAYTQGTHIHVAPGQEHHLPHEAWHVVQQKQGRVQPTMQLKGTAINDDSGLEHEADVIGVAATHVIMPNSPKQSRLSPQTEPTWYAGNRVKPSSMEHASVNQLTGGMDAELSPTRDHLLVENRAVSILPLATLPIQRLASVDSFQQTTDNGLLLRAFAKRNKTLLIDNALDNYNQTALTPLSNKIGEIDKLIKACEDYITLPDKKARRKSGVLHMHQAAQAEKIILERLRNNSPITNNIARLKDLREIENLYHAAQRDGYQPDDKIFSQIQTEMKAIPITSVEADNLQQADFAKLRQIARDRQTPPILSDAIIEVQANNYDTRFENTIAGSGANDSLVGYTGYKVKYGQYLGDAERLGTLVHEMTHISVGKSYNNTKAFLSYAKNTTVPQIIALSDLRTKRINNLKALLAADKTFSNPQRNKITEQLNYALSQDKMENYMNIATKDKTPESIAAANNINTAIVQSNGRLNLTIVEYDTVINQIMVYMHIWDMPQNNAFYTKLRDAAQEAFNQRDTARAG